MLPVIETALIALGIFCVIGAVELLGLCILVGMGSRRTK
jgi:hypothetical protein